MTPTVPPVAAAHRAAAGCPDREGASVTAPDRRPRTPLRLTTAILGWAIHRRWGARACFYGIADTSLMEAVVVTTTRDRRRWQVTADAHHHLAREVVTIAARVARHAPALDTADLHALLDDIRDQHAGRVAVVELPAA